MEEGHFRPLELLTPELIRLKFGTFDYVRRPTPHAKYCGRREGGGGGEMGEFAPSRDLFGSLNAPAAYSEKCGFALNAPRKYVSVVGAFLCG